ncbi:MAG: PEPxxWA-CTERM sorting domain-containing protein [Pseudomonadota bacterium]
MRFALLAAVSALGLSVPAFAAVTVTINANAYGTFTTYCTAQTTQCMSPLFQTPSGKSLSYTFNVASVTDGGSFSFNDFNVPLGQNPATVSGQFKLQPGGGYSGVNLSYYQDTYRFGVSQYTVTDLRAPTFSVSFAGNVPEPTTWAMMIGGFGAIGAAMRYRRRKVAVSFA